MDAVTQLATEACACARVAGKSIETVVVPALPHARRGIGTGTAARIVDGRMFDEDFLGLLDTLSDMLRDMIDAGTTMVWEGHEHDPSCGHVVPLRDERIEALVAAFFEIRALWKAIAATLDAAQAYTVANKLTAG